MRRKGIGKLIMAGVSLLMALVLLAVGTFAWFTTSTTAEVSGISVSFNSDSAWPFEVSTDYGTKGSNATWEKELNVSKVLTKAELRPISTYDMQHWYLADYDYAGNVTGLIEVPLSDIANREDKTADPDEDGINYVLYFDMWVRTRDPELTYELRLNNPNQDTNNNNSPDVDEWETVYGTYVLWSPVWDTTENKYTTADDAMASIRVGFQMFDQSNDSQIVKTVIYEPNADLHKGLGSTAASYEDISYIQNGTANVDDASTTYTNGSLYSTTVPHFTDDDNPNTYEMLTQETDATNRFVILQEASSWDDDQISALTELTSWDSRFIKEIGRFVNSSGTEIDNTDLPCFAEITKDTPQHIRVFFWLEGQDVDCWNQITGGSIYANLEFRGDAVESEGTEP